MIFKPVKLLFSKLIDSGIKSVIDTHIITPAAKASEDRTILLVFLFFIKIKIVPIIVDKPASKDNINAITILFIKLSPS